MQYGRLGYFVKYDTVCLFGFQSEHFVQMPGYGLSLAVFIGSQPYSFGFGCRGTQFAYQFLFFRRYFVQRCEIIVYVYAEILFSQVADMSEA